MKRFGRLVILLLCKQTEIIEFSKAHVDDPKTSILSIVLHSVLGNVVANRMHVEASVLGTGFE